MGLVCNSKQFRERSAGSVLRVLACACGSAIGELVASTCVLIGRLRCGRPDLVCEQEFVARRGVIPAWQSGAVNNSGQEFAASKVGV